MGNLRGYEWLILLLIVVLLFGAKRLPDTARGLGRSLRILKAETKGLRDDDAAETTVSAVPVETRHIAPVASPTPATSPTPTASATPPVTVEVPVVRPGQDATER